MKQCKRCNEKLPDICFVDRRSCYLCILKTFPPKSWREYKKYRKAVAVQLMLSTPIYKKKDAFEIVDLVGLDNLETMFRIKIGTLVPFKPEETYMPRLVSKLI